MGSIIELVYPDNINMKNILIHTECQDELKGCTEESGLKDKFTSQFRQRIKFLEEYGVKCVNKSDWFEKLKGVKFIYSMKFKSTKNIRILFTIKENKVSILLCCFEERGDKTKGKNSYKNNIEIALRRFKEID